MADGYDDKELDRNFDGQTLAIGKKDLTQADVAVSLPKKLEKGVVCYYDGKKVESPVKLSPGGSYICEYRKNGFKNQTSDFKVAFNEPREFPLPGEWLPLPVKVTVPALENGVTCRIDKKTVSGGLLLDPGEHTREYVRDDYVTQSAKFTVEAGKPTMIDPPSENWEESDGLKKLKAAEDAATKGNLDLADNYLKLADVYSAENQELKSNLDQKVILHRELKSKVRDARDYFYSEMYYDAAEQFFEAHKRGYSMSQSDVVMFNDAIEQAKKGLGDQLKEDRNVRNIGKTSLYNSNDIEKHIRNLVNWKKIVAPDMQ